MTQVFLDNVMPAGKKLDITSWVGGKLYVGGWGAVPEAVPDLAADVLPQMKEIQDMLNVTKGFLNLGIEKEIKLHSADRCYRPLTQYNRPIITKVPWSQLGFRSTRNSPCGGVYINTGHNSDGMTLGPGSGKVMSELLLGQPTSVSISALDL